MKKQIKKTDTKAIDVQTIDDVTNQFIHGIAAGVTVVRETGARFSDAVRAICAVRDQSARMTRLQHVYKCLEAWVQEPGKDCRGEDKNGQSPEVSKVREVLIRVSRECLGEQNGISFSLKDNTVEYKAARVNSAKRGASTGGSAKPAEPASAGVTLSGVRDAYLEMVAKLPTALDRAAELDRITKAIAEMK